MTLHHPLPYLLIDGQPTWQMPELPSLRKLPPRATFWLYPDAEQALQRTAEASPLVQSLNGAWDFTLFDTPREVTSEALQKAHWRQLAVPGNWTMQLRNESWYGESFNKPHYTNIQMPFPEPFPFVPEAIATGVYRNRIAIPADWAGQRIVIHFGGCEGMLAVYLDGRFVGFNKDSRTPAEYDITTLVSAGQHHELICVNPRYSDASWIEDQDHWWQGGIHRDVYLYATPTVYLHDVATSTTLNEDFSHATLHVQAFVRNLHGQANGTVHVQLFDATGKAILDKPVTSAVPGATKGINLGPSVIDTAEATVTIDIANPQLWSAERPYLYTVVITLEAAGQRTSTALRVGVRHIVIRNRELLINGQPVMIHGINYHEHHDEYGKAVPRSTMELDIRTMKAHNINAVRTSHYPNNPYWLELCDEYGLFLLDEANIENHYLLKLSEDIRVSAAYMERVRNMVHRDRNHACVVIWSLGNESGYGPNHDMAAAWIRHVDPSRPLHYEGAVSPFYNDKSYAPIGFIEHWKRGAMSTDLICPMYATIDSIIAWAQTTDDHRPLILCEYAHAMGNSTGSLCDYYAAFETYHGLQGGFIWEWLDHGIKAIAPDGTTYWRYGGDFGELPHDGNFVTDGMVWPDRTPHPGMREFMYFARPAKVTAVDGQPHTYRISNRRYYTTLNDVHGRWAVRVDGVIVQQGEFAVPTIAPQQSADVTLPITIPTNGECFVDFEFYTTSDTPWAPAGHVVAWEQITTATSYQAIVPATQPVATLNAAALTLHNGTTTVAIHPHTGQISHFINNTPIIGPTLNLWRAPTDNDVMQATFGFGELRALPLWQKLGLDRIAYRVVSVTPTTTNDGHPCIDVTINGTGRDQWNDVVAHHRYTVYSDGTLRIDTTISLAEDFGDLPRVGISLKLPTDLSQLEWYGHGPHDNYNDRKSSTIVARHLRTVADQYVPYIMPQEHGHKVDTRWLTLSDNHGHGIKVWSPTRFEFSALPYSDAELTAATHTIELPASQFVHLNLDCGMRGLGTGLFVDTLPEYRINERAYQFSFFIAPLA